MENSVKAVYIAAGLLIGILILSTFALVFGKGGQFLETIDTIESTEVITQYNSELINYNRDNNNIFDVITACNKAYDINYENMFDDKEGLNIFVYVNDDNEYAFYRDGKIRLEINGSLTEKDLIEVENQKSLINLITQTMQDLEIDGKTITTTLSSITVQENAGVNGDERIQEYIYTFNGEVEYDKYGKINQINFTLNTP